MKLKVKLKIINQYKWFEKEIMEKEFIGYNEALALKELGFDEPCFGYFDPLLGDYTIMNSDCINPKPTLFNHNSSSIVVSAPTFSQAFRFFREKYNLHAEPYTVDMGAIEYCFQIRDLYSEKYVYDNFVGAGGSYLGTFSTPEDSEIECLKKLIEIVKKKK